MRAPPRWHADDPAAIDEFRRPGRSTAPAKSAAGNLDAEARDSIGRSMNRGNATATPLAGVFVQIEHDLEHYLILCREAKQHNASLPKAYLRLKRAGERFERSYGADLASPGGEPEIQRREKILEAVAGLKKFCDRMGQGNHLRAVAPNFDRLLWMLAAIWTGAGGQNEGHANGSTGGPFVEFLRAATRSLFEDPPSAARARTWVRKIAAMDPDYPKSKAK
jgi:hypothetical protein